MFPPGRYIFGLCRNLIRNSGEQTPLLEMDAFSEIEKELHLDTTGLHINWAKIMAATSNGRIVDCERVQVSLDVGDGFERNVVFEGLFTPEEGTVDTYCYYPAEAWVEELQALAKSEGVIQ